MCALESHVKQALSMSGRVLSPSYLVKNLRCVSRSFQMWRQEDAHEYMRYLIEALQKCCHSLEVSGGVSSKTQKSLIHKVFGGQLRSQVKCTQCSYCSNTYDPFLDLSLEIVRAESLLKALARFTAVEVLDGDNKYRCSRCKTEVRALKQFTIDKAPHILTVQFKRFSSSGGLGGKIDKKVQFDRTLDLKPFVNGGEDEDLKYSLYGVLVHSGWSTHSGHYYCFVRTGVDMWHVLDDSRVSQVSEKSVLEQKAYILFYIRSAKAPVVPDSNHHGHWGLKASVVSDSDYHGGSHKYCSNGTHLPVNGTSKMNGLCSVNTISEANGILERNGSVKALQNSNGHIFPDSLALSKHNSSRINGISLLESSTHLKSKSGELVRSDCLKADLEISHQRISSAPTTSSDYEVAQVSTANIKGHLETSCRSENDSDQLPLTERKNKGVEVSAQNIGAPAARRKFFEAADFAVPRWSEVEGCIGDEVECQNLPRDTRAHCGYVLDEWDEEYDRGKRKKVRNKSVGKQTLLVGNLESPDYHKKRKKVRHMTGECTSPWNREVQKKVQHATAESTSPGNREGPSHGNLFQAVAGSRVKVVNYRLKIIKKRRQALGYKLFLRRHLFKHF